jgi:molybdenum cofactor biosynthesis protein B
MSYEMHRDNARQIVARCMIVTLSDTRTAADDLCGNRIAELLASEGHLVIDRKIIPDDPVRLGALLHESLSRIDVDAILTNGGTGISPRDQTIPVIEQILDTPLPGFGELFRMLSWEQIASGAMLSRACGGVARGKLLFAMPGSPKAVELAMTRLILPELRHLLHEMRKQ